MRWSLALGLSLALGACEGHVVVLVVFDDGGGASPDAGDVTEVPVVDGGVIDLDGLLPVASSVDDFGALQGGGGWYYGFARVEDAVAERPAPGGGGTTGGTGGPREGGSALVPVPGAFEPLDVVADRVPLEPGVEWVPRDDVEWLYLGAEGAHPYGPVTAGGLAREEAWPVRRWRATWTGSFFVRTVARTRPEQGSCPQSDGVFIRVQRGAETLQRTLVPPPEDPPNASWPLLPVDLAIGEALDVIVEPGLNDVCDATVVDVEVYEQTSAH